MAGRKTTTRGFKQTSSILGGQIRRAGESRGFAVSRVLTHWDDIVGADNAKLCRPVEVGYARGGFGATLTVLCLGAQAPIVEMQKDQIRDRVNAAYGYNAIARIRVTQTAKAGFAEARALFAGKTDTGERNAPPPANPEVAADARLSAAPISDSGLRAALERLGASVLGKART